ncbi:hypothetical protein DMP15_05570 [Pseudonocardia sp. UM4_GMWB1]
MAAPPRRPAAADRVRPPEGAGGFAPRGGDGPPPIEHPSFPPARRPDPSEGQAGRAPEPFVPNGNAPNGGAPHGGAPNGGSPNGGSPNGAAPHGATAFGGAPNGAPPRRPQGPPPGHWSAGPGPAPQARPLPPEPQGPPNGRPYGHDDGPAAQAWGPRDAPRPGGPYGPPPGAADDGPDEIPTSRLGARRPAPTADDDGGPPTQFGAPPLDDEHDGPRPHPADAGPPTGACDPYTDDYDDRQGDDDLGRDDRGYESRGYDADPRYDDRHGPAGYDDGPGSADGGRTGVLAPERPQDDDYDDYEDHGELAAGAVEEDEPPRRRSGRRGAVTDSGAQPPAGLDGDTPAGAAGTGQAWAVVIAQWIGGAVAGAAIWVLFRYLWTSLPIVALSLAVVLTVGLVLGVRALLRNDDLRTTLFAVLVGLLLTVSPAILVLLDR